MKRYATNFLALCLLCIYSISTAQAQTPQGINYQAALRNPDGSIMASTAVNLRFTIVHNDGTPLDYYIETHTASTTAQGIINVKLGNGTAIAGTTYPIFANIPWSEGNMMLKVEVQEGSAAFVDLGTQELVTVPFAFHAANTEAIADVKVAATTPFNGQVLKYNGTAWAPGTDDNATSPTGVAGGDLSGTYPNPTIANGAVTGAKINSMGASSGQVLKYSGGTWTPGNDDNTVGWGLSGNAATGSNFIGTTNAQPLHIRTNNEFAGYIGNTNTGSTSIGYHALSMSSVAGVAFGARSLENNTTGINNSAFGYSSLLANVVGNNNAAFGFLSLNNSLGGGNSGFGSFSLVSNTTGIYNSAVGLSSMDDNTTGSYNTALGYNAGQGTAYYNSTSIGFNAPTVDNNRIRLGNSSTIGVGAQIGWTSYSDARIKTNVRPNVPGLDFIKKLRPVTYKFDIHKQNRITGVNDDADYPEKYDIEKITQTGFIAQEVEAAAKEIGYDFSGISLPSNDKDLYGLRYSEFVVPLVKAVQEQQELIEELKIANQKLLERMDKMEHK